MKKIYPLLGILGPIIYIAAVFLGGALRNDYSPFYNAISELSMAGVPNKILMDVLFGIYNVFIVIFGIGAYLDSTADKSRKFKSAAIMLAVLGILGLLVLVFTQDPRGTPATLGGTLHIVLSGISSALTIIAIVLIGLSLKSYKEFNKFYWYSYASAVLIFTFGGITASAIASNGAYGGLFERITIFLFMIWLIIFSYILLRRN